MRRFPWKGNLAEEQPLRICVYDTETYISYADDNERQQTHRFRIGVASFWRRYGPTWKRRSVIKFDHPYQFWNTLYGFGRPREPVWVYAHNAAFDATIVDLWRELDCGNLVVRSPGRLYVDQTTGLSKEAKEWQGRLCVDTLPFIVEAKHDGCTFKFVDTMNYLPCSLEKIGQWVGIDKIALPEQTDDDDAWYARCERDVEITDAAVMKLLGLWRERRLGNWQMTLPALAYSSFRHVCPGSGIVAHGDEPATPEEVAEYWIRGDSIPLDAYDISRLERRAYYGARTLVAYVGDVCPLRDYWHGNDMFNDGTPRPIELGPVTAYDVNGLYAKVMRDYNGPIEYLASEENVDLDRAKELVDKYACIADVRLYSDNNAYPIREEGKTIYARGQFITSLAGPELQRALAAGDVDQVHTIALYHRGTPFTDYVGYWWGVRLAALHAGDTVTAKLAKNLINSLYGKLSQRKPVWQPETFATCPARWGTFIADKRDGQGARKFRAIAGNALGWAEQRDCRHTFTAAGAWITSAARCYMDDLRAKFPPRSVLYQDTDSLFVLDDCRNHDYIKGWVDPVELGKLKVEGRYEWLSIFGPKNYTKDGVHVVAGLKANAVEIGEREWRQWCFDRPRVTVSRRPDGTILAEQEIFTAKGSTRGVSIAADGWTKPVRLCR